MPNSPSLFGSLVWWELVRLARRRQASRGRVLLLYLLLLTIVLFAVWWSSPSSPIRLFCGTPENLSLGKAAEDRRSAAYFAESLALILLEAQLLFVAILTPLYAAIAVSEEKDRQTLSLLLTTELTDREIVWSKTIARVVFVLSTVAAGIPVLMLVLLFGGVSLELIASGYALIVGTTILSASIGVNAACRCLDTRTALVRTYAHAAVLIGGLPFVILAYEFGGEGPFRLKLDTSALRLGVGFGFAFIQAAIGLALLFRATKKLRTHEPTAGAASPTAYPEPPRGRPTPTVVGPRVVEPRPLPPLDDADPVLWKERHVARTMPLPILDTPARWLGGVMAIIAAVLFVVGAWKLLTRAVQGLNPDDAHQFNQQGLERPVGGVWLMTAGVLAAGLYLLPLMVGITACVARERHRRTLESLLMTLIPRRVILWSKVRAHLEVWLVFGVGSVTAIGCGFGAEGGMQLGLVAMAAVAAGFWFATACGALLSVRCRTTSRAFLLCLLPVIGVIALPLLAWRLTHWYDIATTTTAMIWTTAILAGLGCVVWLRAVAELGRGE